ncbi:MAG: hypothetical protein IPG45_25920 [Deltaproteobacteria bacterium]|jgi:hypothetical protein|nr:hypothetical protein [Deltaproteobacteria bacterium]
MSGATHDYRIIDEPQPSKLSHLAVNPFWILLGGMLGGFWLAGPWFVLNSIAIGSATRRKELEWLFYGVLALLAGLVLVNHLAWRVDEQGWDLRVVRFGVLAVQLTKLAIYYLLHNQQSRSFQLYEYFGGLVRNGALVAIGATFVKGYVLAPFAPILRMVLS